MSLKSGGMQDDYFAANFENRLIFREVIDVSRASFFFFLTHSVV